MFKRVVVGCDGSPEGSDAVTLGAMIASATDARLSLVGVFPTSFSRWPASPTARRCALS